jgi:hypothetical protein
MARNILTSVGKFLNPLADADYFDGLENLVAQANFDRWEVHALRALNGSMRISMILITFSIIQGATYIGTPINVHTLQSFTWQEIGYLALGVYLVLQLARFIGRYSTLMTVYLTGFRMSLRPEMIIRNYTTAKDTKLYLTLLMAFFWTTQLAITYAGLKGLLSFFLPQLSVSAELWVVGVLAVLYLTAGIIFPGLRVRIQDNQELVESLLFTEEIKIHKLRLELRKKVVSTISNLLPSMVAADLAARGPAALDDWLTVDSRHYAQMAQRFALPSRFFENLSQVKYRPLASGETSVDNAQEFAIRNRDGQIRVLTANELLQRTGGSHEQAQPAE